MALSKELVFDESDEKQTHSFVPWLLHANFSDTFYLHRPIVSRTTTR